MNSLINSTKNAVSKLNCENVLESVRYIGTANAKLKTKQSAAKRFSVKASNGKILLHPRSNPGTRYYLPSQQYTNNFKISEIFSNHRYKKDSHIFNAVNDREFFEETILEDK
ncbi:hypothetical protein CYY_004204 [Polysphondylium violaceum]|uniref:Uncharacterized protein n=1 Tax=Polysphondylium violaceum TaxID=133409 RepID=A0A8J4PYM5_9MYCE|nr:hypothetical protein CYY_004204 [Polysphondylium violaceum]